METGTALALSALIAAAAAVQVVPERRRAYGGPLRAYTQAGLPDDPDELGAAYDGLTSAAQGLTEEIRLLEARIRDAGKVRLGREKGRSYTLVDDEGNHSEAAYREARERLAQARAEKARVVEERNAVERRLEYVLGGGTPLPPATVIPTQHGDIVQLPRTIPSRLAPPPMARTEPPPARPALRGTDARREELTTFGRRVAESLGAPSTGLSDQDWYAYGSAAQEAMRRGRPFPPPPTAPAPVSALERRPERPARALPPEPLVELPRRQRRRFWGYYADSMREFYGVKARGGSAGRPTTVIRHTSGSRRPRSS